VGLHPGLLQGRVLGRRDRPGGRSGALTLRRGWTYKSAPRYRISRE
jgi:hypothetical protein